MNSTSPNPTEPERRLPIYLLVDCSSSMAGDPIVAVNQGISLLHNDLMAQPAALETVWISVIKFGGSADEIAPLTEISSFVPPSLSAGGGTALGEALRLLNQSIDREVVSPTLTTKGDWKPLVVVLIGSNPTDDWRPAAREIKSRKTKQVASFVVLVCGSEVDATPLKEITADVLTADRITPDALSSFFRWVSQPQTALRETQSILKEVEPMSIDFGSEPSRRLPVYLLVDTSGSMGGDPIVAVNQGISLLHNELMAQPTALETVWISVIKFGGSTDEIIPLTEISSFVPPNLSAGGGTPLGEALRILNKAIDRDVVPTTATRKGDWKPLVFLLTDGEPTDSWQSEAQAVKNRAAKKVANIIAVGCGSQVNASTLHQITENVLMMDTVTPDMLAAFFKWVSASVTTASVSAAGASGASAGAALPPPPSGFTVSL